MLIQSYAVITDQLGRGAETPTSATARGRSAISVAIRCEGCIVFHSRACLRLGASRAEIVEMLGVAVEMGGGPSAVYGAQALACYDEMAGAQR